MVVERLKFTRNTEIIRNKVNEIIQNWPSASGGASAWGDITGTLSSQTDLNSALAGKAAASHTHPQSSIDNLVSDLAAKQATLVSGSNIKTINGASIVGSGDLSVGSTVSQATIDFGSFAYGAKVSVSDATVSSSTRVIANITVASGRDGDELEMSPMFVSHVVNSGVGIDFYVSALQGADGQFIVNYTKA